MTPKLFKSPIKITGLVIALFGLGSLIYNYYRYRKLYDNRLGDVGHETYSFRFKNFPEKNREMNPYEEYLMRNIIESEYRSYMRDSGIILGIGIVILIFGCRAQVE